MLYDVAPDTLLQLILAWLIPAVAERVPSVGTVVSAVVNIMLPFVDADLFPVEIWRYWV